MKKKFSEKAIIMQKFNSIYKINSYLKNSKPISRSTLDFLILGQQQTTPRGPTYFGVSCNEKLITCNRSQEITDNTWVAPVN